MIFLTPIDDKVLHLPPKINYKPALAPLIQWLNAANP